MDTTQLERDSRIRTTALVVLTFIAVASALYFLRPVLLPFVLALFIASGVAPVLLAVERWLESSRAVAIFVTAVISISVTALLWFAIWISVKQLVSTDGPYQAGFHQMGLRIAQGFTWLDLSDSAKPKLPETDTLPEANSKSDLETAPLKPTGAAAADAEATAMETAYDAVPYLEVNIEGGY